MKRHDLMLTARTLPRYLEARGLIGPECAGRVAVSELGGGVSNVVLLAELEGDPTRRWVVKQSLGKLRVKDDWQSDRRRIFREAAALQALRPVLGEALPEVIYVDRRNYAYVMTAAPVDSVVWKESLLAARRSDPRVAREVGLLLARMINASRADPSFRRRFRDRTVFDQLRIDPYYRTTAARHPDVRPAIEELISASFAIQTSLVHGDYSPKNILVRGGRIFLIDFEVVHWGDSSFDYAFLLNHLLLKAFHQPRFRDVYFGAAREFWQAALTGFGREDCDAFEYMTVRHLGALMLARIDGKSPVEYITDEATKERVRRIAKRMLVDPPVSLTAVIGRVQDNIQWALA